MAAPISTSPTTRRGIFLFHNAGNGKFDEVGLEVGASLPEGGRAIASMGVEFRDLDNDALPDISVTGMINDSFPLFRNQGPPLWFDDVTPQSGLAAATRQLTGWGSGAFDFDNDGLRDLFFVNAHFPQLGRRLGSADELAPVVFRNEGKMKFRQISAGLEHLAQYRGAAFADFDNDGRVDVAVSALNGNARIFRNATPAVGHWLGIRLRGVRSNRMGIGAVVTGTADARTITGHMTTSVGYASSSEAIVRMGLGMEASKSRLEIQWPNASKTLQSIDVDRLDQVVDVTEPK
jgi:hypothetical protein